MYVVVRIGDCSTEMNTLVPEEPVMDEFGDYDYLGDFKEPVKEEKKKGKKLQMKEKEGEESTMAPQLKLTEASAATPSTSTRSS